MWLLECTSSLPACALLEIHEAKFPNVLSARHLSHSPNSLLVTLLTSSSKVDPAEHKSQDALSIHRFMGEASHHNVCGAWLGQKELMRVGGAPWAAYRTPNAMATRRNLCRGNLYTTGAVWFSMELITYVYES